MATDGQPGPGVGSTRQSPTPNDPPTSTTPNNPPRVPSPVRPAHLQPFFLHDDDLDPPVGTPEETPKFLPIVPGYVASSFTFGGCLFCLASRVVRSRRFGFRFLSAVDCPVWLLVNVRPGELSAPPLSVVAGQGSSLARSCSFPGMVD
jgi:hypothetical protein